MGGKTSNASIQKYKQKSYDQILLLVPKGKREEIKLFASKNGESVNTMVNRLIDQEMSQPEDPDQ